MKPTKIIPLGENNGQLRYVNWTEDGKGRRITNEFLLEVISGVCNRSMVSWEALKSLNLNLWHPLRCPERMCYSTFAASIADITPIHLSEMPISRKDRGADSAGGRTDFWAIHKNHNFFIELKRTTIGLRTAWTKKTLAGKFSSVEKQTKQLKSEAKTWRDNGAGSCVLIGLQVILPYSYRIGDKETCSKHFSKIDAASHLNQLMDSARSMEKCIDFCAVWEIPAQAQYFEDDESNRIEWNPYIGFVAKILF
jgi:hypothetical protein